MICSKMCVRGCYCIDGYVRDINKRCIPLNECPNTKCSLNEHLSNCEKVCERSCETLDWNLACRPFCGTDYVCVCDSGFVRNQEGICVLPENCENS